MYYITCAKCGQTFEYSQWPSRQWKCPACRGKAGTFAAIPDEANTLPRGRVQLALFDERSQDHGTS